MTVTEDDLGLVLGHCRDLLSAADELREIARLRGEKAEGALRLWEGSHSRTFVVRKEEEDRDIGEQGAALRREADAWARVWADTVDRINGDRRAAAVEAERASRGSGESFIDLFVGDDSGEMVRSFVPVTTPTAETNYSATGGLERYG